MFWLQRREEFNYKRMRNSELRLHADMGTRILGEKILPIRWQMTECEGKSEEILKKKPVMFRWKDCREKCKRLNRKKKKIRQFCEGGRHLFVTEWSKIKNWAWVKREVYEYYLWQRTHSLMVIQHSLRKQSRTWQCVFIPLCCFEDMKMNLSSTRGSFTREEIIESARDKSSTYLREYRKRLVLLEVMGKWVKKTLVQTVL